MTGPLDDAAKTAAEKFAADQLTAEKDKTIMTYPPEGAKNPTYMKEHGGLGVLPDPKVHREQPMRIAKIALDYYNRNKKIKFELVEVRPVNSVPSSFLPYKHINFTARSRKEGSQEQLFFAELQLCARRQTPSGYSVICCEPLGSDSTAGRRGMADSPRGTSLETERKSVDFTYCFACGQRMLHPEGTKYVAGHCKVPRIYDSRFHVFTTMQ